MRWRLWRPDEPEPHAPDPGLDDARAALDEQLSLWPEIRETREHMKRLRRGEDMLAKAALEAMRDRR